MKSQPNAMKRTDLPDADGPADGLCAIDFRAGLALLPWLPMSPGDVKLIFDGIFKRGTLGAVRPLRHRKNVPVLHTARRSVFRYAGGH
jgi:hypothetical protein